ncbi:hypothetical protein [Novosphingobium soli]|uniref:hypothetical protein n=1 Tax=Novosphingobium soli TaxID=574956 RepID=UPI0036D437C0
MKDRVSAAVIAALCGLAVDAECGLVVVDRQGERARLDPDLARAEEEGVGSG